MIAWIALALAAYQTEVPTDTTVVRGVITHVQVEEDARGLRSTYEVHVEERLRGAAPDRLQVTLPGGEHQGRRMEVAGLPLWKVGDDAIVSVDPEGRAPLNGQFVVHGEALSPALPGWPEQLAHLEELLAASTL